MTSILGAPAWLDEIRLEPGPPFSVMGTRALSTDDWLIVDASRQADLGEKAGLLESQRSTVVGLLPGADSASAELLDDVRAWLSAHGLVPPQPAGDEHPLIEAARLVQEDLVVMQRIDDVWVVTAGVVCFPSHWAINDKLGQRLDDVHARVAHYETELRAGVNRLHDRLRPGRPVWRRNWFVVPTADLHLPMAGHTRVAGPVASDGTPMWIRSERQTLRRLVGHEAIVFTIRVQRAPLGVLRERPDVAAAMLATLRSWDEAKRLYTSTGGASDRLITWLETVVATGGE